MRRIGGIIAGVLLAGSISVSAQENSEQSGQGFSPENDLDCALYVGSLIGEAQGVMTPDVQAAYLGSMTYFIGRYEAQRGTPINQALAERYPEFLKQDAREMEQICGLRTRGFASRMETVSRVLADVQTEVEAGAQAEQPDDE